MTARRRWIKWAVVVLGVVVILGAAGGGIVWWKFFKRGDQTFASDIERFKYGSLGSELLAGIPYPIFMILPRVFPDLIDGHGGWAAFGLPWEEGERLPVGLSIKRLGFERVTLNCALCHTTSWRLDPADKPQFAVGGPSHTFDFQRALAFVFAAANDRRFTGTRMVPELALHFDFDWIDVALYKFFIIPATRELIQLAEEQMAWTAERPPWGPGRDDAFNLPKFVLTQAPWDDSVGNTDFPALWRMDDRDGHLMHWGGEADNVYAVVATSALGVGALPHGGFDERAEWLTSFIGDLEPPPFPGEIDPDLAARGEAVFDVECATCHSRDGARVGTAIGLDEIGTDPEHVLTWTDADAERMNTVTAALGLRGGQMQGAQGYVARPLVGVWLLGPYLHNGSVPTVRDLLSPPGERPVIFYRGYDVVDLENVGFVSSGPDAENHGARFDTTLRGNSNSGHAYGVTLPAPDKQALIEYLKTL